MSTNDIRKSLSVLKEGLDNLNIEQYNAIKNRFEQAEENPLVKGSSGNRFWLIANPTNLSTPNDIIVLVDTHSAFNIAAGSQDRMDFNFELYPYDQKEAAFHDAVERWANKPSETVPDQY